MEPTFTTYDGDDPAGYALSVNIARRHLTKGQQAMVSAQARSISEHSIRATAKASGVSTTHITRAKVVLDHAPDLADAVVSGAKPLDAAYEEARSRKTAGEL